MTRNETAQILGHSAVMTGIRQGLKKIAAGCAPVIIEGETGTGKELSARFIHQNSPRSGGPFICLNCSALPETLAESILFGCVKGAYTGALNDRIGLCQAAHGGTLFLDEIVELPARQQAQLLRFLDSGEVLRLGDTQVGRVDVRVVCASNRSLREACQRGSFRWDLYNRLNVHHVLLPALSQHREDIAEISGELLKELSPGRSLGEEAVKMLQGLPWRGNVRELRNALWRACETSDSVELGCDDFSDLLSEEAVGLRASVSGLSRERIEEAMREAGNNQTRAAQALGIHRNTLRKLLKSGL